MCNIGQKTDRIIKHPEPDETHMNPQSPAPGPAQDNPRSHIMCPRVLSKHSVNSARLCTSTPAPVPVPSHSLDEEPFPNVQPRSLLTQVPAFSLGPNQNSSCVCHSLCFSMCWGRGLLSVMENSPSLSQKLPAAPDFDKMCKQDVASSTSECHVCVPAAIWKWFQHWSCKKMLKPP